MFSRSSAFLRSHAGKRMWRTAQQQSQQQSQKRAMGGGGAYMETNEFGERMGEVFGTIAWLWVFWRFKQDGKVLLGMEHPWDHGGGHGHDGHIMDSQLRVQGLMNKYSVKSQTEEEMIANWDAFNEKSINPGDDDDDDDDDDDEDEDEDEDDDDE